MQKSLHSKEEEMTNKIGRRGFMSGVAGAAAGGGLLASVNQGQAATGEPIPIGAGIPMTGFAAADGIEFKRATEIAVEEINAMGGILGRPIEVHIEDTKDQGAGNIIPAMQRLIDRYGVHAIVNGYNTGAVCAEYDTIADAGIPYIHHNTDIQGQSPLWDDSAQHFIHQALLITRRIKGGKGHYFDGSFSLFNGFLKIEFFSHLLHSLQL